MSVYLGKYRKCAAATMTRTHATVTRRIESLGDKLYVDNFLSSPGLFDDLHMKAINCCGTVRMNRKGMPSDFGKKLRLKQGDVKTRVMGGSHSMERQMKCKHVDKYALFSGRG
jgi:hypothetical protein